MTPKPWYTSKTLWVAVLTIAIGALVELGQVPQLAPYTGYLTAAIGIANLILRFVTTQPIGTPNTPAAPTDTPPAQTPGV